MLRDLPIISPPLKSVSLIRTGVVSSSKFMYSDVFAAFEVAVRQEVEVVRRVQRKAATFEANLRSRISGDSGWLCFRRCCFGYLVGGKSQ